MRTLHLMLALAAAALPCAQAAEKWRIQYFYDQDDSTLAITDLQFTSASQGFAVGQVSERNGKQKPVRLTTKDGGANWSLEQMKTPLQSLFFLNGDLGWMVARKSIWKTEDGGKTWKQNKSPDGLLRVHFIDPKRGWAVGVEKSVYATEDGGETWKEVPAADEPKTSKDRTVYNSISFSAVNSGVITGFSRPRREAAVPDYMVPENPSRELPAIMIMLQTRDAGKTWQASSTSIFGTFTRLRLMPSGSGLGLIEYQGGFRWPSEVIYLEGRTGTSKSVYRERERAVTDVGITDDGFLLLGAVETVSNVVRDAVPGKLKMIRTRDMAKWEEMDVDYRAVARRVVLATSGKDAWVATDTGMILKLSAE